MLEKPPPSHISDSGFDNLPRMPDVNEKLRKAIEVFSIYLRIEDVPEISDSIFILGGSSLEPVKKAAELFKKGFAQNISFISTGGRFGGDTLWNMKENEKYHQVLEKLEIPEEAIISDGITTNTLMEAKTAIPFLKEHGIDPKKVILVARPIHQRRAFATFKQQHPEITYLNCPADEVLDINDLETRQRLIGEAERLLDYSKKGDIEKQGIPMEVLRAAAMIRMDLKEKGVYLPRAKPDTKI